MMKITCPKSYLEEHAKLENSEINKVPVVFHNILRQTNMMAKNETVFAQHEIPILAPGKAIIIDLFFP
jgi:hypothetical protein